jgi:hypothetical protein
MVKVELLGELASGMEECVQRGSEKAVSKPSAKIKVDGEKDERTRARTT